MRNLDQGILNTKQGLEPVIIIGVNWTGSGEVYYGETAYENISPQVMNMPELEQAMNADGSGVAQSITLKLNDTDGVILTLLGSCDIYLAEVNIYQWFKGYSLDLKVKMFEGVIVGPITWDEGSRSVEIQATTRRANVQVSFSYDETNTPLLSQFLLGKVWPLPFGTPIHYPALQLQEIPSGVTLQSFGVPDPSIFWQIAKLKLAIQKADAPYEKMIGAMISAQSTFGSVIQKTFNDFYVPRLQAEMRQNDQSLNDQINTLIIQYSQQSQFLTTHNMIMGGYKFPQNVPLKCKIGDQLFTCTFIGKDVITNPNQACPVQIIPFYPSGYPSKGNADPSSANYRYTFDNTYSTFDKQTTISTPQISGVGGSQPGTLPVQGGGTFTLGGTAIPNWGLTYPVVKEGFTWISAGSSITLIDDFSFDFLVSFVPGTLINVYAYKAYNGTRKLTQVPARYYDVIVNGNLTYVRMKRPLSIISYLINMRVTESEDYLNQTASDFSGYTAPHTVESIDWEDQLYVTFESSIGPNIVDILIFLITYYTPYKYDTESFDTVKGQVADYPANFVVTSRPLVDELMNDICYQSRCALILKDGEYFLKYLAILPTPTQTITLDNIEEKTLQINTTPVESLVTRYTANWRTDYSPDYDTPNKIILKYQNVKYGYIDGGHDFFIYNQAYLVRKSALFWSFRTSNVFKTLKFNVFLDQLNIEIADAILVSFSEPFFANGDTVCEVTDVGYNVDQNSISLTLNTWVKVGQMDQYLFAFPGGLDETDYFFPPNLVTGGASLGYNPGNIPAPRPFNYLANYSQSIDYSGWPDNPGDILGYDESMKAWADRAAANTKASASALKQQQDDEDSARDTTTETNNGTVGDFFGDSPIPVSDSSDPANDTNQRNTNIPFYNPETPVNNPQLTTDYSVPPVESPAIPPGGSGGGGSGVPGQIVSGEGNTFQVNAFLNGTIAGPGGDSSSIDPTLVTCNEVHNDSTLKLDPETWVTVFFINGVYYLIQPSWAH